MHIQNLQKLQTFLSFTTFVIYSNGNLYYCKVNFHFCSQQKHMDQFCTICVALIFTIVFKIAMNTLCYTV